MDKLKQKRNEVEDLCFQMIPREVFSNEMKTEFQRKTGEAVLASINTFDRSSKASDTLLNAIASFATFQEHSEFFFPHRAGGYQGVVWAVVLWRARGVYGYT
jgi:hypothetical protein